MSNAIDKAVKDELVKRYMSKLDASAVGGNVETMILKHFEAKTRGEGLRELIVLTYAMGLERGYDMAKHVYGDDQ